MLIADQYQINKISKELKAGEAKIRSAYTREHRLYYVVDRLDLWRTDHVPSWVAPELWDSHLPDWVKNPRRKFAMGGVR